MEQQLPKHFVFRPICDKENEELLALCRHFSYGFKNAPDATEWRDTDCWAELCVPIPKTKYGKEILRRMKHYLGMACPFSCSAFVRRKPLRLFINKVGGGVSKFHFDSVPQDTPLGEHGDCSWTVVVHLGGRGVVKLHMEGEGEGENRVLDIQTQTVYGFPGYRVSHKTIATLGKDVERYSIVCFFKAKNTMDALFNK
jgi:hypothetical protein